MKKLILATITTACTASVFAQGTVIFNNAVFNVIETRVFGPSTSNPFTSFVGNRPTDTPPGTTTYPSDCLLIGTVGGIVGSTAFAQLLGANGANQPESSLLPGAGALTSFRTGAAAGVIYPTTATFNNIPPASPAATLEMVVWDNRSGLYPTWAQASVAWLNGLLGFVGKSGTWSQPMGGGLVAAPNMVDPADPTQSLHSFNVIGTPEPTSVALLALGAAMLILRRRK